MDILDCMAEALGDSEGQTMEEIQKDIEDEGCDYKPIMDRLREDLKANLNELKRAALDEARQKRLKTESTFREKLAQFAGLGREEKLARLTFLLDAGLLAPSLAYRDLTEESDQDLESLYEDAELARLIADQRQKND